MTDLKKKKISLVIAQVFLFAIPIFFISFKPDTDLWFLLNGGRYVMENGIPFVEPFSIHEGLKFVMQQWLTNVIFWLLYSKASIYALYTLVVLCYCVIYFVLYKLCLLVSENNKLISMIVTFGISCCLALMYLVTRPQTLTAVLLIIEVYLLELYARQGKSKLLLLLPIISIIGINIHAAYWPFLLVTMLPYIMDSFKLNFRFYKNDGFKRTPLFLSAILIIATGFINPYGLDSMTYFTKSFGDQDTNKIIKEMSSLNLFGESWIVDWFVFAIILFSIIMCFWKFKTSFKLRYLLLCGGYALASFMTIKSFMLYLICSAFTIAYGLRNVKIKIKEKNPQQKKDNPKKIIALGILLIITIAIGGILLFYVSPTMLKNENEVTDNKQAVQYIVENYDKDKVVLYCGFNDGAYAEFMGLRAYIDARAEVYIKGVNKKEDIFKEYTNLVGKGDKEIDYREFIDKYQFTHLLVENNSKMEKNLKYDNDFKIIYQDDYCSVYITED